MRLKKLAAALMLTTMCGSLLTGCGSGNDSASTGKDSKTDEKITATIKVWGPAEDQAEENGKWLQTMCEKFNSEHPNWDLTFDYGVCAEADAGKTVTQDPSNSGDVYFFANDQLQTLIDANAIAKLGGETEDYVKKTNSGAIVDSVSVDGNVYGVPFTTNTWFMYYDKRVFTEDDVKNLDKMLEVAASKNKKVSFKLTDSWYIASFYVGNGCTFFGDGTDESAGIDFEGEKATAVTNYLIDLVNKPAYMTDDSGSGLAGLKDGSVAAFFSGTWDLSAVKEALGEENVGIAQAPTYTLNGKEVQMKPFFGSKAVAVNKTSPNQKVATQLALWLANEDSQKTRYESRGIVPCNTKLLESLKGDALAAVQNGPSIMQPFVSKMNKYWTPAENMGKGITSGSCTHDNAEESTVEMNKAFNTEAL